MDFSILHTVFAFAAAAFEQYAGLLSIGLVVALVVDLANSGTVARIVSFICVGLLLMLVGYLAPVPPRRREAPVA